MYRVQGFKGSRVQGFVIERFIKDLSPFEFTNSVNKTETQVVSGEANLFIHPVGASMAGPAHCSAAERKCFFRGKAGRTG